MSLSACSWIRPAAPEAEVRLVTDREIAGCDKVGITHVSVVDNLDRLSQVDGGVAAELSALARNSAVQLGGNRIVALSDIKDGAQSFAVFNCKRAD